MKTEQFEYTEQELEEITNDVVKEIKKVSSVIWSDLKVLKEEPQNVELLKEIMRGFHTIKGTSSIISLNEIRERLSGFGLSLRKLE